MHIFLSTLRNALWIVSFLLRHIVFLPSALGGTLLACWLVFGHPVSDLNHLLQKEATAWRTAPPGHYMLEGCEVSDKAAKAAPPEGLPTASRPAACPATAVSAEKMGHYWLVLLQTAWFVFFLLSNVIFVVWDRGISRLLRGKSCSRAVDHIRRADGKLIRRTRDE